MRLKLTTFAAAMALATPAWAGADEEFQELREEIWQDALNDSPGLAISVGDRRGDGKLYDFSLDGYEAEIAQKRAFLERLNAIDVSRISESLVVDYDLLKRSLEDEIAASAYDHTRFMTFTTFSGWFQGFAGIANGLPLFTMADYESYIGKLEAFAEVNDAGIARTRMAVAKGMTLPCGPLEGFDQRISRVITQDVTKSQFWNAFSGGKPSTISDAEWTSLQARTKSALENVVMPEYRELLAFYTEEYAPNCRTGTPGILATPGGAAYYENRVASFTTTDMTADEVHDLGLSEVSRIRAEMEEVAASAGFDTREAYIEHLRTDPQYYMTDGQEYLRYTQALAKEIDFWMPKLFGKLPRLPYTVQPIPAAQAPGNTTAYYEPGSLETGQAGIYRLNLTELDQRPLWELPALGVHEAVPGHHHQIALQQELDIHPLRANGTYFTAFVEGWGLYSERLGIEMGIYNTPARQMGRLSYEMWRATRLVVDTGIHAKGWDKQRAVDYMLDNTALSPANIDAEVNRYITWPGQALAYKIGELKIRELRALAETELGASFDIRAFHDTVLENGSVPLSVLEAHVIRWIEGEKTSS